MILSLMILPWYLIRKKEFLLTGYSHSGIINMVEYSKQIYICGGVTGLSGVFISLSLHITARENYKDQIG
jgi:metal-dependent hydrolase (beta-lactamase superfamily II)